MPFRRCHHQNLVSRRVLEFHLPSAWNDGPTIKECHRTASAISYLWKGNNLRSELVLAVNLISQYVKLSTAAMCWS